MTRFAAFSEGENWIEVSGPQLELFLCNPKLSPCSGDKGSIYALDTTTDYTYCIESDGLVRRIVSLEDRSGNCGWEMKFSDRVRKKGGCK